MFHDAETSWSASLVTAISFLGLLVATMLGLLSSLSGDGASIEYYVLGTVCAATFAVHLRA